MFARSVASVARCVASVGCPDWQVSREDFKVERELAEKPEMLVRSEEEGGGVRKECVEEGRVKEAALSDGAAVEIARLLVALEERFGKPQDFEWGMEGG